MGLRSLESANFYQQPTTNAYKRDAIKAWEELRGSLAFQDGCVAAWCSASRIIDDGTQKKVLHESNRSIVLKVARSQNSSSTLRDEWTLMRRIKQAAGKDANVRVAWTGRPFPISVGRDHVLALPQQRVDGVWLWPPDMQRLVRLPDHVKRRAATELLEWVKFTRYVGWIDDLQLLLATDGTAWLIDPSAFYSEKHAERCTTGASALQCVEWALEESQRRLQAMLLWLAVNLLNLIDQAPSRTRYKVPPPLAMQAEVCEVACRREGMPVQLRRRLTSGPNAESVAALTKAISKLDKLQRRTRGKESSCRKLDGLTSVSDHGMYFQDGNTTCTSACNRLVHETQRQLRAYCAHARPSRSR